jgi:hypothetical protein
VSCGRISVAGLIQHFSSGLSQFPFSTDMI